MSIAKHDATRGAQTLSELCLLCASLCLAFGDTKTELYVDNYVAQSPTDARTETNNLHPDLCYDSKNTQNDRAQSSLSKNRRCCCGPRLRRRSECYVLCTYIHGGQQRPLLLNLLLSHRFTTANPRHKHQNHQHFDTTTNSSCSSRARPQLYTCNGNTAAGG